MNAQPPRKEMLGAVLRVAEYRPWFSAGVILLSLLSAVLEGIGISFIVPIIETARSSGTPSGVEEGLLGAFLTVYDALGLPFTLEYIILGVAAVITVRFTASFLVDWMRIAIRTDYVRALQTQAFENTLDAQVSYFDERGSDEILNAIITESKYAGRVIKVGIDVIQEGLLSLMYVGIALVLAPWVTVFATVFLGGLIYVVRYGFETGYSLGDRVAEANERLQNVVQAGTQGIRDVKLFTLSEEVFREFQSAVDQHVASTVRLGRNQSAMTNFYQLTMAVTVFALIYVALRFTSLSLSGLGIYLFAMFRLGPRISSLNNKIYTIESNLPHLVRMQGFIDELEGRREPQGGETLVPDRFGRVAFDDVDFSYDDTEQVLDGLSFEVERGEFVAFVGASGGGKSTLVSLLTRMYEPNGGTITADGTPIDRFDIHEWRSHVAAVRQNPHLFNDTLRANVTIGNRDATQAEVERVCETAQVTEFVSDLPQGYDTLLGDDGVRLSGGQRQRVAIARALLKDADLLVLDEATSDLDSAIEERVHEAIQSMERDIAVIAIAHRLSTVVDADRIYTIEGGRITEVGNHDELLANGGKYAELYSKQTQEA